MRLLPALLAEQLHHPNVRRVRDLLEYQQVVAAKAGPLQRRGAAIVDVMPSAVVWRLLRHAFDANRTKPNLRARLGISFDKLRVCQRRANRPGRKLARRPIVGENSVGRHLPRPLARLDHLDLMSGNPLDL